MKIINHHILKFYAILFLILLSCEDQNFNLQRTEINVVDAKGFFEREMLEGFKGSNKSRQMLPTQPVWTKAFNRPGPTGVVLQVPLEYGAKLYTRNGKSSLTLDDLTYLVIGTDKRGVFYAELVSSFPDENFKRNENHAKHFSGVVVVEDLHGNLKAQYQYRDGVVVQPEPIKKGGKAVAAQQCVVTDWFTCVQTSYGYNCHYSETTSTCTASNGGTSTTNHYTGYQYYPPTTTGSSGNSSTGSGGTGSTGKPPALTLEDAIAKNLENMLVANPEKLLNAFCAELQKWKELAKFLPPQVVIDKLKNLQAAYDNFSLLTLANAGGKVVNMDNFSVTVSQLPTGMSADMFLMYIRTHMNEFVNQNYATFITESVVETGFNESALWASANPVGAIIHIDIPMNDGTVVCTESTSKRWKFSTIESPWDSDHPVSGTREFGYVANSNGTYTFYTRGVDRMTSRVQELAASATFIGNAFLVQDGLWSSYQHGIKDYVETHGGIAAIESPIIHRPDWKLVADVLAGDKSLESLGCK